MTDLVKLEFVDDETCLLTPECEQALYNGVEWSKQEDFEGCSVQKRYAEGYLQVGNAVNAHGILMYGHVLVTQCQAWDQTGEPVGRYVQIIPMDDAKFTNGRQSFYGEGILR